MRFLFVLFVLFFNTEQISPASAEQAADPGQLCVAMSELAGNVMKMRQNGVALTKAMEVSQNAAPSIQKLARSLIMAAYDQPRFSVKENQRRSIVDFQNQIALQCYKSVNK